MLNVTNVTHALHSFSEEIHLHGKPGIALAAWKLEELELYLIVTLFIVLSGFAKLVFHHAHFISSRVPESVLLIVVGAVSGAVIKYVDVCQSEECEEEPRSFPRFTPELFFYFLLPPIILEAAYSLHNRVFMENLRTVLLYAVFGTILNFLLIGGCLIVGYTYGGMGSDTVYKSDAIHQGSHHSQRILEPYHHQNVNLTGMKTEFSDMTTIQILLFSSLISAVDPVAVLAVFSEVGVNPDLYFLVFGESLLNDGVAVVIYNMMKAFAGMEHEGLEIHAKHIFIGIGSFFTVALGGLFIGLSFGVLTAFVTKYTNEVRVLEPLATFGLAYLSYLCADLVNWSGIISLIGCGMLQAHYAFKNISDESLTTINYFIKMLSSTCDCIIFLYLGMALFGDQVWHTGFICWTLVVCLVVRFIGVFAQTFVVNKLRHGVKTINYQEQFIMAYGGLRGAVGFSLVLLIDKSTVPSAGIFVTTTLAVVISTVFIQGSTIKPLVNWLGIDKKKTGIVTLSEELNEKVFEHVMAGIEIISGKMGHHSHYEKMYQFDQKYLKKWLCIPNYEKKMQKMYERMLISDHLLHLYGPSVIAKQQLAKQNSLDLDIKSGFDNTAFLSEDSSEDQTMKKRQKPSFKSAATSVVFSNRVSQLPLINRINLTSALQVDPRKQFYQVHDKNLTHEDRNLQKVAVERQRSAQKIRDTVLDHDHQSGGSACGSERAVSVKTGTGTGGSIRTTRRESVSSLFSQPPGADLLPWGDSDKLNGSGKIKSIVRQIEGLPWEDRGAMEAVLAEHLDSRRRKSQATPHPRILQLLSENGESGDVAAENIDTTQL